MVAAKALWNTGCFEGAARQTALRVLVNLGLASLLLVLGSRSFGGNRALELCRLSNTLALLALSVLLGDLRAVMCIAVGETFLLARRFVGALRLTASIGL
jgi:hypothetical protein